MQSFVLNIHILDPYGYDFQSNYLYLKVQLMPTYFQIFLKPIFYTDFHISQKKPGI